MICFRCHRPLSGEPMLIRTNRGVLAVGPRCGVLTGLITRERKTPRITTPRGGRRSACQLDWVDQLQGETA